MVQLVLNKIWASNCQDHFLSKWKRIILIFFGTGATLTSYASGKNLGSAAAAIPAQETVELQISLESWKSQNIGGSGQAPKPAVVAEICESLQIKRLNDRLL